MTVLSATLDKPVNPVAAVVPLNLAGVIPVNFAWVRKGGFHVAVVGHRAWIAGLSAIEAFVDLENQLKGVRRQMVQGLC